MKSRWRVFFTDGTPARDVIASSAESAKRTALCAERLTGNKNKKLRVMSAQWLFGVGRDAQQPLFTDAEGGAP